MHLHETALRVKDGAVQMICCLNSFSSDSVFSFFSAALLYTTWQCIAQCERVMSLKDYSVRHIDTQGEHFVRQSGGSVRHLLTYVCFWEYCTMSS